MLEVLEFAKERTPLCVIAGLIVLAGTVFGVGCWLEERDEVDDVGPRSRFR